MSDTRDTLSLAQLGERWGKDERTIRRWKDAGDLGFLFKIGREWRARIEDIEAFEDRRKIERPKNNKPKRNHGNENSKKEKDRAA